MPILSILKVTSFWLEKKRINYKRVDKYGNESFYFFEEDRGFNLYRCTEKYEQLYRITIDKDLGYLFESPTLKHCSYGGNEIANNFLIKFRDWLEYNNLLE